MVSDVLMEIPSLSGLAPPITPLAAISNYSPADAAKDGMLGEIR
jgi:hypothetical protein